MIRILGVDIGDLVSDVEETGRLGVRVITGFVGAEHCMDIWHWHWQGGLGFDGGLIGTGWQALYTEQDFDHFGIWVNIKRKQIFSYVEGDTFLRVCPNEEVWFAECADVARFHKCELPLGCARRVPDGELQTTPSS